MQVRDLDKTRCGQLEGYREFNVLRIDNLSTFFKEYQNNNEYYKTPFQILEELESTIKFENRPMPHIEIAYKELGDILFDLKGIQEVFGNRVVTYSYSGTIQH